MLCLNEGSLRLKGCFSCPTKEVSAGWFTSPVPPSDVILCTFCFQSFRDRSTLRAPVLLDLEDMLYSLLLFLGWGNAFWIFSKRKERLPWMLNTSGEMLVLCTSPPCTGSLEEICVQFGLCSPKYAAALNSPLWSLRYCILFLSCENTGAWLRSKGIHSFLEYPREEKKKKERRPSNFSFPRGKLSRSRWWSRKARRNMMKACSNTWKT